MIDADGFRDADEFLREEKLDWRVFWAAYICLACYYGKDIKRLKPDSELTESLPESLDSSLESVRLLKKLLRTSSSGLLISDWLKRFDKNVPGKVLLLFDGLDSGFGHTETERERRTKAIEGLFSFLTDQGDSLTNLKLKIMLREDIWKKLKFENKSHLFGRSTRLVWSEKADFYKVVLKQALNCKSFAKWVQKATGMRKPETHLNDWSETDIFRVWGLLIGERMKGTRTAFTRNWVWSRLSDGNDDHSPRYLLYLFHEALDWERSEHSRSPYEKSIIRPRSLMKVLGQVSEQALSAIRDEEFPELKPLLECLHGGRTPVSADALAQLTELVALGREVGLLVSYQ